MQTPFTTEQFFSVFENYNTTVFPAQIILLLLGCIGALMLHSGIRHKDRIISGILGILWLWIGLVYHISFFSEINKVAIGFGVIFLIQGLYFLWLGFSGERIAFEPGGSGWSFMGYFFILYGLILYPTANYFIELHVARTISLGLPCPTNIMTLGFLMLAGPKQARYLLIIPSIWAVIGISTAFNLGVYQDLVMPVAAIIAWTAWFFRRRTA